MSAQRKILRDLVVGTSLVLTLTACGSFGPQTLDRDQLNYGHSVGDAWKNQMLSNLVKIRYVDMPVFVDVGQIVSGYSLETSVDGAVGFGNSLIGGNTQGIGAKGTYTDRPTITYVPKTGEGFLRSMLEPIRPSSLMALILAGYNSRLLLTWGVESINGVKNFTVSSAGVVSPNPEFGEFLGLLGELQKAGAVGFELEKSADTKNGMVFFYKPRDEDARLAAMRQRSREIIKLPEDRQRFRILYAPYAIGEDVLAIQTRSILQMMAAMARFVDVPADKVAQAAPGLRVSAGTTRPFRVHVSKNQPADAFAQVFYHGDWYWIDHEDLNSKRVFTLMLFITTLTNQPENNQAPVLTIPTG